MAENERDLQGPGAFNPAPELARTMIGTAPLFEADSSGGTAILPAMGGKEARELVAAAQRELAAVEGDSAEQARLHHGLAVLFETRLDDPHGALIHHQRAYELAPDDRAHVKAALACYRGRQNWTLTLELLDADLRLCKSGVERAVTLLDKAVIYEERLANGAMARELLVQARLLDPTNVEVAQRLRRLLLRLGDQPALLALDKELIASTDDRRRRCLLYADIARLQLDEREDEQAAIESYAVAFVEDPTNTTVSDALLALYARRGRWGDVVDVLLTIGDLSDSDHVRRSRYLAAARLCRERLDQNERALELLERVRYDDLDAQTAAELAELLSAAGRHEELAELYMQQLEPGVGASAALTHYRLAEVLAGPQSLSLRAGGPLSRHEQALPHYLRALEADPHHLPARHALERAYRQAGDAKGLYELQLEELSIIDDPVEQAFQLTRLGLLCAEHLGDLTEATKLLSQALATVEGFAPARRELVLIYERGGAYQPLLSLLEQEISVQGVEAASQPLLRMAELAERELGDLERAAQLYRRALEVGPRQVGALRALGRIAAALGAQEERLELLEREAELADDAHLQRHLAYLAASLCEGTLERQGEAERRFVQILKANPGDGACLAALARLYLERGDSAALAKLYRGCVAARTSAPAPWRAALRSRLAELREQAGDVPGALEELAKALEDDPSCAQASTHLARLQRAEGRWEELFETLERQAEVASEEHGAAVQRTRAATLLAAGELALHRLEDDEAALGCARRAVSAQPDNDGARELLLSLLMRGGQVVEAAEVLEEGLRHTFERRPRLTQIKRLGALWARDLGDEARAVVVLEQGLSLDSSDVELLDALDRLYRRLHDDEGSIANAERLAACSEEPAARCAYLHEAAVIAETRLAEGRDPALLYRGVLEQLPGDARALDALARIGSQRGDHEGLQRVYRAQLDAQEDASPQRRTLLLRLAAACESSGDAAAAEAALADAASGGGDWLVQRELRRMRERLERWPEVAQSLEAEAASSRHDAHRGASLSTAAELYLSRFDDAERAIAALRRVLARSPFHEQAAARLEQLLVQREGWEELVEVVRERLEAAAQGAQPESGSAIQARIELLVRMAWIQREHLRQPTEALATLKKAAQLDPHHVSTLLTLSELQVASGRHREAAESLERVVTLSDDPDLLLRAHGQLAELFAEHLDDPRRAISSYQSVLAIAPKDRGALGHLQRLFRDVGDWDNAADIVGRLLDLERDAERQVEYTVALAEIAEQGFGDPEQAADRYYDALEIDPGNEQVVDRLLDLLGQLGRWERLCAALRSYLAALPEEQQLRSTSRRMQLAEILHRHLARPTEALEQYQAVMEIDPTDIRGRLASARLLADQGRLDEAVARHREVLDLEPLHRESLAQLRTLWARAGLSELAYAAAAVLVVSDLADEPERRLYREHRALGVRCPQLALDAGVYNSTLLHPAEQHGSRAILNVLCEAAHRIRPPDFERWQVGKSDRLPPRSEDPLKTLVQQLHICLGLVRDVEVYISHARPREVGLLATDPPSLVVGSGVMASFSSRQVRFWIARLLSYVRNRTWVAHGLDGTQLGTLVVAARRLIDSQAKSAGLDETEVVEMSRLIQRSLSRRGRRALDETVRGLRDSRAPGYGEWALGMRLTALRTALWAVNDLETAFDHLRDLDPQLAQVTSAEQLSLALRYDRLAAEVLRFWLSDELQTARRAVEVG